MPVKPRPYQQQCRSNIVECYKSNDSFDMVECCFDIVAGVDGALRRHLAGFATMRRCLGFPVFNNFNLD